MDAINYTAGFQNPIDSFNRSFASGNAVLQQQLLRDQQQAQIAKDQAAAEQARLKAEADAAKQAEINAAMDKIRQPGATYEDYMKASMFLPKDYSEAVQKAAAGMKEEERKAMLVDTTNVFAALRANKPEWAVNFIRKQGEAERAAGNTQGAEFSEALAQSVESGEVGAKIVEQFLGDTMTVLPGGKDAFDALVKMEQERRAASDYPALVKKMNAEIDKAESEAEIKAIEAKYAEEMEKAKLDKAKAEANKLTDEIDRLKKSKGIAPEKVFEEEEKLRKEYTSRISQFTEMKQTYANIKASSVDKSGAGDIALVTGFMKMLDPGSVVRETEFANARDSAGLLEKLQSMAKKVADGQFLSDQQRKDFSGLAGKYMEAAEAHEKKVKEDLKIVVNSYGLSEGNVFGVDTATASARPASTGSIPTGTQPAPASIPSAQEPVRTGTW